MQTLHQPKRVLYVHHTADLYGSSRALVHLLAELDRREVTPLVVLPQRGPLVDLLRGVGVEPLISPNVQVMWGRVLRSWRVLPFALNTVPAALAMRAMLQAHSIDIIHSNTWNNLSGALGAMVSGLPHVWHIREILLNLGGLKPALARFTVHNAQHLICISQAVAAQFEGYSGPAQRHVIYDGLPHVVQAPATEHLRREWGIGADQLLIGVVGRLHPQKGQDDLLRAFAQLKSGLRDRCVCVIIGEAAVGEEQLRTGLEALAAELGIAQRVHFAGYRANARELVAELDLLVAPSTVGEGLGGVLLEAMSAEVPVIASATGGMVEVIDHGVSGLLVPPRQPSQLAAALAQLLESAELRAQLATAGRHTFATRFSSTTMATHVQRIYQLTRQPSNKTTSTKP